MLCTDLDRTLIPNGNEPESPNARERFRRLVSDPGVTLAYVSGRDRGLVEKAIAEYDLPQPDYLVGDVGTSLYERLDDDWRLAEDWAREIGADWGGDRIRSLFADRPELRLQEPEKQGRFKLSFYAEADLDAERLRSELSDLLSAEAIRATLIWSLDEQAGVGLLDVLPERASKFHAVEFLMRKLGRDTRTTVFSGDSGNDLEVLTSYIPAVLVANGHPDVREEAVAHTRANDLDGTLYCAKGGWSGMNGNYSAGILEGVAHFRPDLIPLMES
ncbi:Alpha,alpha-trehalose-phosphate synthase [Imhoffiella purpurea]|uniref:Alpha,alpha-trehalose-phosphate synthase n=1 Tax=Imhoffiella purpurea TaxID=1249627 RepID=W9VHD4_9GAMM|nr:Alpha,alpha-trehalose-phosphate synthase [Imhoffiella purpurea]